MTASGERLGARRVLTSPGLGAFAITTSVRPSLNECALFWLDDSIAECFWRRSINSHRAFSRTNPRSIRAGFARHPDTIRVRMTAMQAIPVRIHSTTLPDRWSRCLVNHLHLFFVHPATVYFDFRHSAVNLTKISRRHLNIDGSYVLI